MSFAVPLLTTAFSSHVESLPPLLSPLLLIVRDEYFWGLSSALENVGLIQNLGSDKFKWHPTKEISDLHSLVKASMYMLKFYKICMMLFSCVCVFFKEDGTGRDE